MLKKDKVITIITTAIVLFIAVQYIQNIFEFGSEERKDFYFVQIAYVNVLFAYCFYLLLNAKIVLFWLWYSIGELINEIFFNGSLSHIETMVGFISLLYYLDRYGKTDSRPNR